MSDGGLEGPANAGHIDRRKRNKMAKVIDCADVGFDCDGVIRAETEEEIQRGHRACSNSARLEGDFKRSLDESARGHSRRVATDRHAAESPG